MKYSSRTFKNVKMSSLLQLLFDMVLIT